MLLLAFKSGPENMASVRIYVFLYTEELRASVPERPSIARSNLYLVSRLKLEIRNDMTRDLVFYSFNF